METQLSLENLDLIDREQILKRGIGIGDYLELVPGIGRKKRVKLMFTQYQIRFEKREELSIERNLIEFPDSSLNSCHVEILLLNPNGNDEEARYMIRSLGPFPFRINGFFTREAILQKHDEIVLGFHCLRFVDRDAVEASRVTHQDLSPKILESDLSVLLEGETGTGKTHLARKIHKASGRVGEFIHINLSSFAPSLIESEIFGHKKGAFTGAVSDKVGAILEAKGGTLFLDEVDSLPIDLQTKLLLFLDNQEVRPVGASHSVYANVRLLFASGRDLKKLVEVGEMRKDFYYRLASGFSIKLAPLRERADQVHLLCREFEEKHHLCMSHRLITFYQNYRWPGNIRQLLGHLDKKRVCMQGQLMDLDQLDELLLNLPVSEFISTASVLPFQDLKERYIEKVYYQTNCNIKESARLLKISMRSVKKIVDASRQQ